ncbi:NAD-binding protein [Vibrio sinaloensis]|nr:NAD-binding protein [Vibrio sinaloensis]
MSQDKFDFGFAIDWMRKDLGFCLNEAERVGLELPLTKKRLMSNTRSYNKTV